MRNSCDRLNHPVKPVLQLPGFFSVNSWASTRFKSFPWTFTALWLIQVWRMWRSLKTCCIYTNIEVWNPIVSIIHMLYMHLWSQNKYIAQPCTACESYFLCKVCMNQYLGVVPSIFSNVGRQPLTMRHTEHVFLNKHESISGDTVDGKKILHQLIW